MLTPNDFDQNRPDQRGWAKLQGTFTLSRPILWNCQTQTTPSITPVNPIHKFFAACWAPSARSVSLKSNLPLGTFSVWAISVLSTSAAESLRCLLVSWSFWSSRGFSFVWCFWADTRCLFSGSVPAGTAREPAETLLNLQLVKKLYLKLWKPVF